MSCTNPLLAVRIYKPAIGKQVIKILPRSGPKLDILLERYGTSNLLQLPCGHCPSCLQKRKKEWSVRCAIEALDHRENSFVTLTYAPEFYMERDVANDWKQFIKNLRNKGYKVRYFGCCEKGDQYGRQHFHILLFGFFPSDTKRWAKSEKGVVQYTSEIVDSCWKKGLATVSEFSPYAASYTAGYVVKKFALDEKDSFHFQSTKPGIGAGYILRNMEQVYENDKLVLNFGSHRFAVPRYFDKLAENCALDLDDIRAKRLEAADLVTMKEMREHNCSCFADLWKYKQETAAANMKYAKRRF